MIQKCWICGKHADSSEHRVKKSDLLRHFGRGSYRGNSAVAHVTQGEISPVQGPNSDLLKYKASLCKHCNNTFTQPFDRAYDTFVRWVENNEDSVLFRRFIDFHDVYGSDFELSQRNLYKYFTKSFGCRLVYAGVEVPPDMVELLKLDSFRTCLRISFAVNEDIRLMPITDRKSFFGKGGLCQMISKSDPSVINGYYWDEHFSWFTICYFYNIEPDGNLGSSWIANSRHIYLGSFQPLSQEMRDEVM